MLPAAVVSHEAPGRLRIRIRERAGDVLYFEHVVRSLSDCATVDRLVANPDTAGLLVLHHGDRRDVSDFARVRRLFRIAPTQRRNGEAREALALAGACTLFALAGLQAFRGKLLPAGLPMIFQGWAILQHSMRGGWASRVSVDTIDDLAQPRS